MGGFTQGQLRLSLLGKPEISCDGQLLTQESLSLKGEALLIYLAVTGESVSRSLLATLLWGDMAEERAKANLRLALTKLRPFVAAHLIIDRQEVAFDFHLPYWLDVEEFEVNLAESRLAATQPGNGASIREIVALYRGPFLHDFYVPEAPEFEEWMRLEQERLRQLAINALTHLAAEARRHGDFKEGIRVSRKLLTIEPWLEEAHQQLMWMLAYSGQRSAALAQYEACRRALAEELAVEPSAATTQLYQRIKQEAPEVGQTLFFSATSPTPGRATTTLPSYLTPLVGREAELTQIERLLGDTKCHLLTLVGPGGIGKSRLAVATAEQQGNFADGVIFVPLVGVMPARPHQAVDLLVSTIANALGYLFSAQRPPRELLLNHLAGKEMLLVLDNFEQLLPATPLLSEILQHAPHLKLLVTSRVRLGIEAEWLFDVEGLSYPPAPESASPAGYPAIRLFAQTAQRIKPGFLLQNEEAAVVRICQIVAGFPLAIELAANWVRGLSCAEIVARLEAGRAAAPASGLDVLSTTTAIVAERHQSMRSILAHSWALLDHVEQRLFRQLSVFRGGFELDAAEVVSGASVPFLAALVDKSWLRRDDMGQRYRVHELLRQYGAEQLAALPGEQATIHQKHGNYYGEVLKRQSAPLRDGVDKARLVALDREVENIRAAWEWLLLQRDIEAIAPFLEEMWLYFEHKGWFQEALLALKQACALEGASALQKARWNRWIGEAYYQMGLMAESSPHFEQSLALLGQPMPTTEQGWRLAALSSMARQAIHHFVPFAAVERSPQKRAVLSEAARTLGLFGQVYFFAGRPFAVLTMALTDLNLSERCGLTSELARGYVMTALICANIPLRRMAGFYRDLAEQTVLQVDNLATKAYVSEVIGICNMLTARWSEAITALDRAVELLDRLEMRRWWDETRMLRALVSYHRGDMAHSTQLLGEALASARQRNDALAHFWALLCLAECALRLGGIHAANVIFLLEDAKALLEENWGRAEKTRLKGMLALAHLHHGDDLQARQEAEEAAHLIKATTIWMFWNFEGYAAPAEVFLALWEKSRSSDPSSSDCKRLAQVAQASCKALHEFARICVPSQPRAWLHQGAYHWLQGETDKASRCWYKSLATAEQLGMPYDEGRAHFEIGRHLPAADPGRHQHLVRASEIFTQLGCAPRGIDTSFNGSR